MITNESVSEKICEHLAMDFIDGQFKRLGVDCECLVRVYPEEGRYHVFVNFNLNSAAPTHSALAVQKFQELMDKHPMLSSKIKKSARKLTNIVCGAFKEAVEAVLLEVAHP